MIMHQENSTPGRCGMVIEEMGYQWDACRPAIGEKLPATLEDYVGVMVFGGPMSANDSDPYIRDEINWMDVPLRENKPLFGICLGAQLLVQHLGGKVSLHKDQHAEIGYYPIQPTNEGRRMLGEWPGHVYQWHREGFSMPKQVTMLATGEEYPNQAFRYGQNAYGIQFHPEVTHWMMNRWTTLAAHRFVLPGAQERKAHFEGRMRHDHAVHKWLREFLNLWIGPADKQEA